MTKQFNQVTRNLLSGVVADGAICWLPSALRQEPTFERQQEADIQTAVSSVIAKVRGGIAAWLVGIEPSAIVWRRLLLRSQASRACAPAQMSLKISRAPAAPARRADWPPHACMRCTSPSLLACDRMAAVSPRWMG